MRNRRLQILMAVLASLASMPALICAEDFHAAFEIDPGQSYGVFQTGWTGPTTFGISGLVKVEVEGAEVRVFNYSVRTTPAGFQWFVLTFSQLASVDQALDTTGDGLFDTWMFSMGDTDCLDDGYVTSYAGVVSSGDSFLPPDQTNGTGNLEISGDWASCSPDAGWFQFELRASETEIAPPIPVPNISIAGAAFFVVLLMLVGTRLVNQ